MTRKQYLDGDCTHREYYAQYVNKKVLSHVKKDIGEDRILTSIDPNFADINLKAWDSVFFFGLPKYIRNELRNNGDFPTIAGAVCIAKEAARQIQEETDA